MSDSEPEIHFRDVAPAIELVCWVIVLMCPFLRLVNGPAVTDDQFVIQTAIFSVPFVGAVTLRLYQVLKPR